MDIYSLYVTPRYRRYTVFLISTVDEYLTVYSVYFPFVQSRRRSKSDPMYILKQRFIRRSKITRVTKIKWSGLFFRTTEKNPGLLQLPSCQSGVRGRRKEEEEKERRYIYHV